MREREVMVWLMGKLSSSAGVCNLHNSRCFLSFFFFFFSLVNQTPTERDDTETVQRKNRHVT